MGVLLAACSAGVAVLQSWWAQEPTVTEVQTWAAEALQASPAEVERWLAESRRRALLPEVSVQVRLTGGENQAWKYTDLNGEEGLSPTDAAFQVGVDGDVDQQQQVTLRAAWDLSDLRVSSESVRVWSEAHDVARLRHAVLGEVTDAWFVRRDLQLTLATDPPQTEVELQRAALALARVTAEIDLLTGGQFARSLASPPEALDRDSVGGGHHAASDCLDPGLWVPVHPAHRATNP